MEENIKPKRGRPKGSFKAAKGIHIRKGYGLNALKHTGISATVLLELNRQAEEQIVLNRGGARSSKSYSIAQLLIEWFFTIQKIKIFILRKTQPSLRVSTKPLIMEIIDKYGLRRKVVEERQDMNLWSPTKGLIHFGGLDDPEKIKSSDWNVVWMEEATEFTYEDYTNLKLRLSTPIAFPTNSFFRNKLFMSFNPIDEFHWIKTKIIDERAEDFVDIHSNYLFNPFLSEDYVKTVEMLQKQDQNYWRIFGLGEWGKLENIIYTNWSTVPYLPNGDKIFGLDFGFVNPTVLVQLNVDGFEVGVQEKVYQSGLTNQDLIQLLYTILTEKEKNECPIYADSAEPQRIEELIREGFWVIPANKSVKDGIDYVKRCRLRITDDSDHIKKEIKGYSYRTDKNGRVLEEPVKFNDHGVDAIRYALYSYALKNMYSDDVSVSFM